MRQLGIALIIVGALLAIYAFAFETSVPSGGYLSDRTHNLGLLQQQMMLLHTGLSLFVAGSFFAASNQSPSAVEQGGPNGIPGVEEDSVLESTRGKALIGGLIVAVLAILIMLMR